MSSLLAVIVFLFVLAPPLKAQSHSEPGTSINKEKTSSKKTLTTDQFLKKLNTNILLQPYTKLAKYPLDIQAEYLNQLQKSYARFSPQMRKKLDLIDSGIGKCHQSGGLSCNQVFYQPGQCHLKTVEQKKICQPRAHPLVFGTRLSPDHLHWEGFRRHLSRECSQKMMNKTDTAVCQSIKSLNLRKPSFKDDIESIK